MILWVLLLFCTALVFIGAAILHLSNTGRQKERLLVYFDIDGTLTTAKNAYRAVQDLVDDGHIVGVITASNRTIEQSCGASWMPQNLCGEMEKNGFLTYNSSNLTAGVFRDWSSIIGQEEPHLRAGMQKALQMKNGMALFPECTRAVLFDDDPDYLAGAKKYYPEGKFVCAGNACHGYSGKPGSLQLTPKLVKENI